MKKIYLAFLVLIAGITLSGISSCMVSYVHGSGHMVSEDRKVGDFRRVSISGGYKVILKQDSSMSLKITADDNLLPYIKTEVSGGRLRIYSNVNLVNKGTLTINIGVRDLDEIRASGAVEIASDGKINTQDLGFKLSGNTKITMDLNAANVSTTGSGDTELNLKGHATSHNIYLSGSGKIYTLDFVVNNCRIYSSGESYSKVNVLNALSVHSSGSSEVKYKGSPSSITSGKSGSASIEKID